FKAWQKSSSWNNPNNMRLPTAPTQLSSPLYPPSSRLNFECLKCPSGVHSVNSICATNCGLSHTQFFISSLVKAHWVRFFSGRLANGQVSISKPLILPATSRRRFGTNPFLTWQHREVCPPGSIRRRGHQADCPACRPEVVWRRECRRQA